MEWTAETWRAYRNYADEEMVQVRFLDETDQDTELDATWVILAHGANWDQDWLPQRVEALGRVPESGEPRFILQTRENRLSWERRRPACRSSSLLAGWCWAPR